MERLPATSAREWDGATYDRIADPMTRWGSNVLPRLRLAGDERVLDAGCGSGRVTEQLLERLPRGRVVAVDASASMLAEASTATTRPRGSRSRSCSVTRPLPQPASSTRSSPAKRSRGKTLLPQRVIGSAIRS